MLTLHTILIWQNVWCHITRRDDFSAKLDSLAVVHETIHRETIEIIEPEVTRDIHRYHQYDYVQPLEVVTPEQSYATNARGEVIHAPGGLNNIQTRQDSHWEQDRKDKGYDPAGHWQEPNDDSRTAKGGEKTVTKGPFPLQSQHEGARVLREIREGTIARSFGGNMTSSSEPLSHPLPAIPAGEAQQSSRERDVDQDQAFSRSIDSRRVRFSAPE